MERKKRSEESKSLSLFSGINDSLILFLAPVNLTSLFSFHSVYMEVQQIKHGYAYNI